MARAIAILQVDDRSWEHWERQILELPEGPWSHATFMAVLEAIRTTNPRWILGVVDTEDDLRDLTVGYPLVRQGLTSEQWNLLTPLDKKGTAWHDSSCWVKVLNDL